jgi:mRNA-degrading endonuclease RelE of RelBE toxin-antitoxin system
MYQVLLSRSSMKAQKNWDTPLRVKLRAALERLAIDPVSLGERLRQPLTMLRSHHVRYKGLEWRIAYQVNENTQVVYVVLIGPHENFYNRVKKLFDAVCGSPA